MALRPGTVPFTLFLGAGLGLTALSNDMNLPALPIIGASFDAPAAAATGTISTFMLGLSIALLAWGPLSDRFGRQPLLLFGGVAVAILNIGCAAAPSLSALIVLRFFSGAATAVFPVCMRAIVRDSFDDPSRARQQMAYVTAVQNVAPLVAPLLGSLVLVATDGAWRTIFFALSAAGLGLLAVTTIGFQESLRKPDMSALSPGRLLANYQRFFTTPACVTYAAVIGFGFACLFTVIVGGPLVFIVSLGLPTPVFAFVFTLISGCIIVGSLSGAYFARLGLSLDGALRLGIWGSIAGGCGATVALLFAQGTPLIALLCMCLMLAAFSFGLILANAIQGALAPIPDMAGVGSALVTFCQMIGGASAAASVGFFYARFGAIAMPVQMVIMALIALALHVFGARHMTRPLANSPIGQR